MGRFAMNRPVEERATIVHRPGGIEVDGSGGTRRYELQAMPTPFLRWQLQARQAVFEKMDEGRRIQVFAAHLPVLATFNDDLDFPIRTATKATGLLPKDELLDDYSAAAAAALETAADRPWDDSLADRMAAAGRLYENPDHVDPWLLGLVEIFEGQTYCNLLRNPVAALHYAGPGPAYVSYQLNGVVEPVGPGDRRFEYLYLMRQLFERDHFHVQQPAYPSGYLFWICEILDKSPRAEKGVKNP